MRPIEQFEADHAEKRLTDYPFTSYSVVFDVGGYLGGWTAEILKKNVEPCSHCGAKQDPYIHVFEPIPEFFQECVDRFKDYHKVKVYNFGLAGYDHVEKMTVDGAASSVYGSGSTSCYFRDVAGFMYGNNIDAVDLMSINIEGGEYDLITQLIRTDAIHKVRNLQVQFHLLNPECEGKRDSIQDKLSYTHDKMFDYPYVWESWRRKGEK